MTDLFLQTAVLLETNYVFILPVLAVIALTFTNKRAVFLMALLATVLLIGPLKLLHQEDRPCEYMQSIVLCDGTFGFPSGHASTAFVLALGTLGTYAFFFFMPLALFIAYTRMYLVVHTLTQVTAGIGLGALVFAIVDSLWQARMGKEEKKRVLKRKEWKRQAFHAAFGIAVIALVFVLEWETVLLLLIAGLFFGGITLNASMLKINTSIIDRLVHLFERKSAPFPGKGAFYYLTGVLVLLTFSRTLEFGLAGIAILAIADALSTLIGIHLGKHALAWNPSKSREGLIAFFVSGTVVAFPFIGITSLLFAIVLAFVETIDFHLDDNLLISVAAVVLSFLLA
ncbi:phosphatase PAP2 family protein [Candidatus Micrarchaeota archaeon]|nr:phosphatase PAP2 family protein [Candidatus Micrarchaeota archaeon]